MTFNGITGYGTTTTQNVNMLSTTISAALSTMASNAAASSLGSLCHLPVGTTTMGGTITLDWDYPLAFP